MHNYSEIRKRNPKFVTATVTVTLITAVMLLGTTAISNITTGSVIAYDRNQAKSDINECGNGSFPENVGCQNIDSQIQGDKNVVALRAQQTFSGADPCVACFDSLTSEQRTDFEETLAELTGGSITTIEQLCEAFAELSPQDRSRIADLLISVLGFETALEIILCLEGVWLETTTTIGGNKHPSTSSSFIFLWGCLCSSGIN